MKEIDKLTPRNIVEELNKYIIGQDDAKRAVAIALRNRWRRQKVKGKMKNEIMPNNIILIGPTGVGKTEIARRVAGLANAPFIKVEASKFTEVGYVGRDVDSMVRDLIKIAVNQLRNEQLAIVKKKAFAEGEERLIDLLLPSPKNKNNEQGGSTSGTRLADAETREKIRKMLKEGKFKDKQVELTMDIQAFPLIEVMSPMGFEDFDSNLQEMLSSMLPKQHKRIKVSVEEARHILIQQEAQRLIDMDKVVQEARYRTENLGIIFLDEIDKIVGSESKHGPDVSRTGVQRDLLPIVEGSSVSTKYGIINTDHILFIAAGAFTYSKPSDLIPEFQGRFPIRVELKSLTKDDFKRILVEPENALIKQYTALFATEGTQIEFTEEAIAEIAYYGAYVNETMENIGARRLHTIMTAVLEDYLFELPDAGEKKLKITKEYVEGKLKNLVKDKDLTRYIL